MRWSRRIRVGFEVEAKGEKRVAIYRERLSNLGWFMKALKEPLKRLCNRADGLKGTFGEARYKGDDAASSGVKAAWSTNRCATV